MKTIYCVNSDSQIWNLETFLIELSFAMSQHSNITIDMKCEGPDLNYLKITDFIKSLSDLYNYDLKKLVICSNNVIQPDIPDIVIKKSSPLHHVYDTIRACKLSQYTATEKDTNPEILAGRIAEDLAIQLDLPMTTMLGPESKFFKRHYRSNWHNQGIMIKEIDIIRSQEGW